MRWFLRRLVFYALAIWVAITLNFLLPRLMPGSPIGGLLARLTPSQIQSNPGIIQTYEDMLGGGKKPIVGAYFAYLHNVATLNFGISTSNYPSTVSEVIGRTLPYSIFLVGVAFLLSFILGITVGMFAAWRRGGVIDKFAIPSMLAIAAFPAFFTSLIAVYFLGLKLGWFPLQHAYDQDVDPGLQLDVHLECVPPRGAADDRDRARLRRRLGAEHAHRDDQHDRRGLRRHGAGQGPPRPARDDALRGP